MPVGQAFRVPNAKDRVAYTITSTDRMEIVSTVLVANTSFEALEPALQALSARPSFAPHSFFVDNAHSSTQKTLNALNHSKRKARQSAVPPLSNEQASRSEASRIQAVARRAEMGP